MCFGKKIPPVSYLVGTNTAIDQWFNSISFSILQPTSTHSKRQNYTVGIESDSDENVSSPDQKISEKDHYFLSTMLKMNDAMDKKYKEKPDKEPGFNRLEDHCKNLILNASASSPFDVKASNPTEFYSNFLAKKSQFKAKDMLLHHLHSEKLSFKPGSSFINNLWNCDFFWLLPDSPSGVSIFFCPETKSANASDIEKERLLALADKFNVLDIEKFVKQKLHIPNTIMDIVWMTQNLHSVIKLCFGPSAHSSTFLKNWADHMYENHLMYTTLHSADPFFFAKVLYAIDNALQIHWWSCSASDDRLSVNDSVLRMTDVQNSILSLSFSQQIPKSISDSTRVTKKGLFVSEEELARKWSIGLKVAENTMKATSQKFIRNHLHPIERRFKTKNMTLKYNNLKCCFSTNTFFSNVKSVLQNTCGQLFITDFGYAKFTPMRLKSEAPNALKELLQDVGIPKEMHSGGAKELTQGAWKSTCQEAGIKMTQTEKDSPWQNRTECEICELKKHVRRFLYKMQTPLSLWDFCCQYTVELRNRLTRPLPQLHGRTPHEVLTGNTPDISEYVEFSWYQPVWYYVSDVFPQQNKFLARWIGVAHRIGQAMCYWLLPASGIPIARTTIQAISPLELDSAECQEGKRQLDEKIKNRAQRSEYPRKSIPF
jgi:hypothetical protein